MSNHQQTTSTYASLPVNLLLNLTETWMHWLEDVAGGGNASVVIFRLSAKVLVPLSLANAPRRGAGGRNRERGFNFA
jgi:hypothetical protein